MKKINLNSIQSKNLNETPEKVLEKINGGFSGSLIDIGDSIGDFIANSLKPTMKSTSSSASSGNIIFVRVSCNGTFIR